MPLDILSLQALYCLVVCSEMSMLHWDNFSLTNSYSALGVNNISVGYSVQYILYICPVYCECVVFPSLNVANVSGGQILRQSRQKS
jgi:hypothetical protein